MVLRSNARHLVNSPIHAYFAARCTRTATQAILIVDWRRRTVCHPQISIRGFGRDLIREERLVVERYCWNPESTTRVGQLHSVLTIVSFHSWLARNALKALVG